MASSIVQSRRGLFGCSMAIETGHRPPATAGLGAASILRWRGRIVKCKCGESLNANVTGTDLRLRADAGMQG